jgi:hypothetical protein
MSRLHRRRAITARQESSLFEALEYYRETKKRIEEWNKKHYSGKRFAKRKQPWYMITTGKQYNYEERTMPYGQCVDYFRVRSEAARFNQRTGKLTRSQFLDRLIQAKVDDWERKNPKPIKQDSTQKDLFENEFMNEWYEKRLRAYENAKTFVCGIGTKVTIFARYVGDTGYPHKIAEFRSDHQPLLMIDGAYANRLTSKTIKKAQIIANSIDKKRNDFIAIKVVDGDQACILLPYRGLPT